MTDFKFNSLKIVSLNVGGIWDSIKRKAIFLFIRKTDANIILEQETYSGDIDSKFWKVQWGIKHIFLMPLITVQVSLLTNLQEIF